jgi:hypothetical protein
MWRIVAAVVVAAWVGCGEGVDETCGGGPACTLGAVCVLAGPEGPACQGPCYGSGPCTTWGSEVGMCVELREDGVPAGAVCLAATCAAYDCLHTRTRPPESEEVWSCLCVP